MPMKQPVAALFTLLLLCTACARGNDGVADTTLPGAEKGPVSEETASPAEDGAYSGNSNSTPPAATSTGVGIVHQIRMTGGTGGFRFDPSELMIAEGAAIRFIVAEGGPHSIVFEGQDLTSDIQTRLDQRISDRAAPLTSGILSEAGEAVTVSFGGMPAGRYPFFCGTHGSAGMKGTVIVQ